MFLSSLAADVMKLGRGSLSVTLITLRPFCGIRNHRNVLLPKASGTGLWLSLNFQGLSLGLERGCDSKIAWDFSKSLCVASSTVLVSLISCLDHSILRFSSDRGSRSSIADNPRLGRGHYDLQASRRIGDEDSCQVCWRTMKWHNGPTRRPRNLKQETAHKGSETKKDEGGHLEFA